MSKRTERMSRSAAERINRKDTVIRQNNAELEELRSPFCGNPAVLPDLRYILLLNAFPHEQDVSLWLH